MKEQGRIVNEGMGGFLNPPTHPEHTQHVETDLQRSPANRGGLSLTAAVACDWLDDATRAKAQAALDEWQRPPIERADVQAWIGQVLGYYRGCYKGDGDSANAWHAGNLRISQTADPMLNVDAHAGVRLIREYYPEYQPTREDFARAYWGTKPTEA